METSRNDREGETKNGAERGSWEEREAGGLEEEGPSNSGHSWAPRSQQERRGAALLPHAFLEPTGEMDLPDGRGNYQGQQAIIKKLSRQESRSSAGNNQEAEQTGITQLSRQYSRT